MSEPARIAVFGAGRIGALVGTLLADRHHVAAFDRDEGLAADRVLGAAETGEVDVFDEDAVAAALDGRDLAINCAPHACNVPIARAAKAAGAHYMDLSEDLESGAEIERLAEDATTVFVPRTGLAPGFASIVGMHLARQFDRLDRLELRFGALPETAGNALKYHRAWSTDGLVNECGNPCEVIQQGRRTLVPPLEHLEHLVIHGIEYEAFTTSGGIGTLCETLEGEAREVNYKTLRYPGHRDLLRFLMFDMRLNDERETLIRILDQAVSTTDRDVIVIHAAAEGMADDRHVRRTYVNHIRHGRVGGIHRTAIQIATASSAAAVSTLLLNGDLRPSGYVRQEDIALDDFLAVDFAAPYRESPVEEVEYTG